MNRRITRVTRDRHGGLWATVVYPGGHEQDEPIRQLPLPMLLDYAQGGGALRDVGAAAVGSMLTEWQGEWRANATRWIDRINKLALKWLAVRKVATEAGRAETVREADARRALLRKVRDWVYEVVDVYLGGVDALGAIPLPFLAIGGATVVGVAGFGAWLANEEERVELARKETLVAVAEAAKDAPPHVRQALADATRGLLAVWKLEAEDDAEGSIWPLVLLGVALAGGGWWLTKQREDRRGDAR